jgi:crossover junction endodeoxyribonuclease RuvC
MRILGIDPGTLNLGWGFIQSTSHNKWTSVRHDSFHVSGKVPFYERLHILNEALENLLLELEPDVAVIEKIFLGKSVDSAFKLGHIRGICAAQCSRVGAQVVEYSPRTVKMQITGSGGADKAIVRSFLYNQLGVKDQGHSLDATDALALAFCHFLRDSQPLVTKPRGAR